MRGTAARPTASVVTKQSIVAMFGWIMPTPFTTPPIDQPPQRTAMCFGRVSVVMIARAKSIPPSGDASMFSIPLAMRSIGRNVPMTPVEATTTSCGSMPNFAPASCAILIASSMPRLPTEQFAQPAFATIACALPVREVLHRDDERAPLRAFFV